MITNQNQWKNSDQVSYPVSTGKEKWMKLTGPMTFIYIEIFQDQDSGILLLTQLIGNRILCRTIQG